MQNIPIAITASGTVRDADRRRPDLVKQVNLAFTKTNFTGYSITIRGIGTQAISVTTDPARSRTAFNDIPFIAIISLSRNSMTSK